ncbi:hypothetical protein [Azospirillum sp.]|uniref:hypothetical protein n=1 Tax=Azospirillum sp. TaxID=34012 RepID=UPI00261DB991|nr:hypothetical protein [Azospirillum sp.]
MTEPTVRCPRCDNKHAADAPTCPHCLSIRRSNAVMGVALVMLVILALVGWIGTLALT